MLKDRRSWLILALAHLGLVLLRRLVLVGAEDQAFRHRRQLIRQGRLAQGDTDNLHQSDGRIASFQ